MINDDGNFVQDKRAKRLQRTKRAIDRQMKIAKQAGITWNTDQPHRYAKKHATDCGIPGCVMCANPRRVWGEKTLQERRFECYDED